MKLFQCLELKKRGTLLMLPDVVGCQCHGFTLQRVGPAPAGTVYSMLKQVSCDFALLDGGLVFWGAIPRKPDAEISMPTKISKH